MKYCFLQCIRLHCITACPFSHPQRLGGNFISFYRFGDCFSPCTHSSFHVSDIITSIYGCNYLSFYLGAYCCLCGHYFSLLCIGHSFIIFLLYRSLLLTWVETTTSPSTAYASVDLISLDNGGHLFRCVLLRANHGSTR